MEGGMTMDREKEREIELESAMYTNCLLLGLDPSIIGIGASNGTPRVGLFRHSNPKLGEQLLYFILSSLRGPTQSAKVRTHIQLDCFFIHLDLCFPFPNLGRSFRTLIRCGQFSIQRSLAISAR